MSRLDIMEHLETLIDDLEDLVKADGDRLQHRFDVALYKVYEDRMMAADLGLMDLRRLRSDLLTADAKLGEIRSGGPVRQQP